MEPHTPETARVPMAFQKRDKISRTPTQLEPDYDGYPPEALSNESAAAAEESTIGSAMLEPRTTATPSPSPLQQSNTAQAAATKKQKKGIRRALSGCVIS